MWGSLFGIFAGIAQGYAYISLFYGGDASQVSLKMIHLKFLGIVLALPALGFFGILFYILGVVFFGMLVSLFHYPINYLGKACCPANQMFNTNPYYPSYTPNKALDAFPRHWIVVIVAVAIPYALIFLPGGLVDGCMTSTYFGSSFYGCSIASGRIVREILLPFSYAMQYIMMKGAVSKGLPILAAAKHFVLAVLVSECFFLIVAIFFSAFGPFEFWVNLTSRVASVIILLLHTLWQGLCFQKCCGHCATGGSPPPVAGTTPGGDAMRKAKIIWNASKSDAGAEPAALEQPSAKSKTNNRTEDP